MNIGFIYHKPYRFKFEIGNKLYWHIDGVMLDSAALDRSYLDYVRAVGPHSLPNSQRERETKRESTCVNCDRTILGVKII